MVYILMYNYIYKHNTISKPFVHSYMIESNFYSNEVVRALIINLVNKLQQNIIPWESEIYKISSSLLNHYYPMGHNWVVSHQQQVTDQYVKKIPDHTVNYINLIHNDPGYGNTYPHIQVEVKRPSTSFNTKELWANTLEQMWDQCDFSKNNDGKIWAIVIIGKYISFFNFNVADDGHSSDSRYDNFNCLNLENKNYYELLSLGIECDVDIIRGTYLLNVIKWDMSNPRHTNFIHNMFIHLRDNSA